MSQEVFEEIRALAKKHGVAVVFAAFRSMEDGTKYCHKCMSNGITHSSRCVHYNKENEEKAMQEYVKGLGL